MKMTRLSILAGLVSALLILLQGCVSGGAIAGDNVPTRFYVLSGDVESVPEPGDPMPLTIRPVILPEYLETKRMATRLNQHELAYSDFHLWGEALGDGIRRVLWLNLQSELDRPILAMGQARGPRPVGEIAVQFVRFEGLDNQRVLVSAIWELFNADRVRIDAGQMQFSTNATWGNRGFEPMVVALNEGLRQLARDLRDPVRELLEE